MKSFEELSTSEMESISGGNWLTWLVGYCFQGEYNGMEYNKFQASVMPYK